jgi:hypothetical protein
MQKSALPRVASAGGLGGLRRAMLSHGSGSSLVAHRPVVFGSVQFSPVSIGRWARVDDGFR